MRDRMKKAGWIGLGAVLGLLLSLNLSVFAQRETKLPIPYEDEYELAEGSFRVADILLAACVVVYLSAHYRLHGITTQAMPGEGGRAREPAAPVKRPADLIRRGELARLLYATGAVVLVGQIVWAVVTNVEVDVLAGFPFRFSDDTAPFRRDVGMVRTRLIAVAGLLFFGMLLARLVFGYWKLRVMTPAQGAMFLMDAGWTETSRERVRVEGWRMWGVKRVADRVRAGWRPGKGKKR